MKTIIHLSIMLFFAETASSQNIKFNSKELYPEGTAYSSKADIFFVSSMHYGKIGKVDRKGNYTQFIDDADLVSTVGLLADEKRNLLYVNISDPGVSIKTNAATQKKLCKIAAYDLTTGKRKFIADLGALNPDGYNFANDVTVDTDGNLYVTNSFSPIIYKVTGDGRPSVFATSDMWKGEGFNLNGIAFHSKGYLLVVQSGTGSIYKVDIKNPKYISKVKSEPFPGADGIILNGEDELIVISNSAQKIYQLSSSDDWKSAVVKNTVPSVNTFPTTGVLAKGKYYVLNAKLNEIFDPKATKTSDFTLQQISF